MGDGETGRIGDRVDEFMEDISYNPQMYTNEHKL